MIGESDIRALIGMLDESDPALYSTLKEALFKVGDAAIPFLDSALAQPGADPSSQWYKRVENLKQELQLDSSCRLLSEWKEQNGPDLMQGLYHLSKPFYPDLEWDTVKEEFNRLHGDCWLLLAASSSLKEELVLFNNFFFNQNRFHLGQRITSGYGFADFFLPNLINLKQGNERALAMAYQYLASRNRLPVFLLNLPVVNLLACTSDIELPYKDHVCYCIDIMQNGSIVNRKDIEPVFSSQSQIKLSGNVEALQDYTKLMYFMVSAHETDPFRKQAVQRLYECLTDLP